MSFFRKPTFNGLYTPFGSPRQRGTETFLTVKEGSTSLTKPLSCPKREDVTALSADFSTSPSLLQGELHFLPKPLFNGLYTPFGARNRFAIRLSDQSGLRHVVRDETAWGKVKTVWGGFAIMGVQITDFKANSLITCRFLVVFLAVSRKKRIFAAKLNV